MDSAKVIVESATTARIRVFSLLIQCSSTVLGSLCFYCTEAFRQYIALSHMGEASGGILGTGWQTSHSSHAIAWEQGQP